MENTEVTEVQEPKIKKLTKTEISNEIRHVQKEWGISYWEATVEVYHRRGLLEEPEGKDTEKAGITPKRMKALLDDDLKELIEEDLKKRNLLKNA